MQNLEAVRNRLRALISEKYGEVSSRTLKALSAAAGVHYTSLARFLLYGPPRQTLSLRKSTVHALALALDANPAWILDGEGSKQLGLWPILSPRDFVADASDPVEELTAVVETLRNLPEELALRASRAAVAAALHVVVENGETMGLDAYRSLLRIDALHRRYAQRRVR